jgi:M6 family metalloprotease-like protein
VADPIVEPINIQRVAEAGETVTQDFNVNRPPQGTLVASISGDSSIIRLRDLVASKTETRQFTEDEINEMPANPPSIRANARRNGYTEYREFGRVGPGSPLTTWPGLLVKGRIDFVMPATEPPDAVEATLVLEGTNWPQVKVPLLLVNLGKLQVDFETSPVDAYQGQEVGVGVHVTVPAASPAAKVAFELSEVDWQIPRQFVSVPSGGSASATLQLRAVANAPLGTFTPDISYSAFEEGRWHTMPFPITVNPPSEGNGHHTSGVPTLAQFGYRSKKVTMGSLPPTGGLPRLLIVLGEYSNFPDAFTDVHPLEYYQRLGFGNPAPPFSTDDPVNPASLGEYFRENSNGRFSGFSIPLTRRVVGPIRLGHFYNTDPGPEARSAAILDRVAREDPGVFADAEFDFDDHVDTHELCVLLVENIPGAMPDIAFNNPVSFYYNVNAIQPSTKSWNPGTVRVWLAGVGLLTPFYQIAHEVSHLLGTVDMYNTGMGNRDLTLMSRYSFVSNDQNTVHLDMWHKLAFGWAEPRIYPLWPPDTAVVHAGADGAIVLWDKHKQATEYFLIERRGRNLPGQKYDANFPGDGVLIWRVKQGVGGGADEVAHLGAPNLALGGSGVWGAGQKTPVLSWSDGLSTGMSITVAGTADSGAMRVTWGK